MENKDVGFTTFLFSVIPTSLYYHLQKLRKSAYFEYKDWNEIITKNNEIGELLCHTQHGKR